MCFGMEKYWKYIIKNEYIFSKVSNSDQVIIVNRNEFNRTKKVNFGKDFDNSDQVIILDRNEFDRKKK